MDFQDNMDSILNYLVNPDQGISELEELLLIANAVKNKDINKTDPSFQKLEEDVIKYIQFLLVFKKEFASLTKEVLNTIQPNNELLPNPRVEELEDGQEGGGITNTIIKILCFTTIISCLVETTSVAGNQQQFSQKDIQRQDVAPKFSPQVRTASSLDLYAPWGTKESTGVYPYDITDALKDYSEADLNVVTAQIERLNDAFEYSEAVLRPQCEYIIKNPKYLKNSNQIVSEKYAITQGMSEKEMTIFQATLNKSSLQELQKMAGKISQESDQVLTDQITDIKKKLADNQSEFDTLKANNPIATAAVESAHTAYTYLNFFNPYNAAAAAIQIAVTPENQQVLEKNAQLNAELQELLDKQRVSLMDTIIEQRKLVNDNTQLVLQQTQKLYVDDIDEVSGAAQITALATSECTYPLSSPVFKLLKTGDKSELIITSIPNWNIAGILTNLRYNLKNTPDALSEANIKNRSVDQKAEVYLEIIGKVIAITGNLHSNNDIKRLIRTMNNQAEAIFLLIQEINNNVLPIDARKSALQIDYAIEKQKNKIALQDVESILTKEAQESYVRKVKAGYGVFEHSAAFVRDISLDAAKGVTGAAATLSVNTGEDTIKIFNAFGKTGNAFIDNTLSLLNNAVFGVFVPYIVIALMALILITLLGKYSKVSISSLFGSRSNSDEGNAALKRQNAKLETMILQLQATQEAQAAAADPQSQPTDQLSAKLRKQAKSAYNKYSKGRAEVDNDPAVMARTLGEAPEKPQGGVVNRYNLPAYGLGSDRGGNKRRKTNKRRKINKGRKTIKRKQKKTQKRKTRKQKKLRKSIKK